jgi:hypothetical protein
MADQNRRASVKGFLTPDQEAYDVERFTTALQAVRQKLTDIEAECTDNEVLRDTVTIACEGVYRQLYALERKCIQEHGRDG